MGSPTCWYGFALEYVVVKVNIIKISKVREIEFLIINIGQVKGKIHI